MIYTRNYGDDNSERLTGKHETSDMKTFSWGVEADTLVLEFQQKKRMWIF